MPGLAPEGELHQLALDKMSAVLGPTRARHLMERILGRLGIELRTPRDLMRFAEELTALGGFEGAVGAMLGVVAVVRGATPRAAGQPALGGAT